MKPYLITTGSIFALITLLHLWRIFGENRSLAADPVFLALTVFAAAMCAWSVRLLQRLR